MTEGRIRWQVPLGSMQDFGGALSQPILGGSISLGGPIVTAGGHPKITEEKLGDSLVAFTLP